MGLLKQRQKESSRKKKEKEANLLFLFPLSVNLFILTTPFNPLLLFTPGTSARAFTVSFFPPPPEGGKKKKGSLGFLPSFMLPVHAGPAPPTSGTLPHHGPIGDAAQAPAFYI
jgi:hypothetical protein